MRIAMAGTGYVGLVSGSCADFGHEVVCVDKDKKKIKALIAGEIPIFETGLDELVARILQNSASPSQPNLFPPCATLRYLHSRRHAGTPR